MARSNSINHDLAVALSPVVFARSLGIEPDSWQSEVLRTDSKRIILNCARQTGKSSIVAILALHHALCQDKSMVLIISHTLQQAAETFRKCRDYYRQIAQPVLSITESVHRLELQNGSRIVTFILLSTPLGRRGFFWDTWANTADWLKIEINADQCPRFTQAFLREEKQTLPDWFFRQEYFNFFAEVVSSVFRLEDIEAAFNHPELPVLDIDLSLD